MKRKNLSPSIPSSGTPTNLLAAIYELLAEPNVSVTDTAKKYGVRRWTLHRELTEWFSYGPRYVLRSGIPEEQIAEAQAAYLGLNLPALIRNPVLRLPSVPTRIRVVHIDRQNGPPTRSYLQRFAEVASPYVHDLLAGTDDLAVAWGLTNACIVDALVTLWRHVGVAGQPSELLSPRFRVVPACAEPPGAPSVDLSASSIAWQLHHFLNPEDSSWKSLIAFPAVLPPEERHLLDVMKKMPGYREIFGGDKPLIGQVNALLTSVSTDNRPWHFYGSHEILEVAKLDTDRLRQMAIGDIAGVLLANPGHENEVAKLMTSWTGIRHQELERLSRIGQKQQGPGIVVVAAGANKAACLERVLSLANALVIDDHLAKALAARLNQRILEKANMAFRNSPPSEAQT